MSEWFTTLFFRVVDADGEVVAQTSSIEDANLLRGEGLSVVKFERFIFVDGNTKITLQKETTL